MLTAQGEEADVVSGLEIGSDDYILKPFRPREVLARIRVRLRDATRRKIAATEYAAPTSELRDNDLIEIGEMRIERTKMRVFRGSEQLTLSAREFEVLNLLASNPGRPFSRDELLAEVWQFDAEEYGINVSVFFSRLRRKLERDPENPKYILTVRGIGYRFVEPDEIAREIRPK